MQRIYLDNNATTALDPLVIESMKEHLDCFIANPSSVHYFGQEARQVLQKARQTIALFLKSKPHEIIFTSGGTEALNLLIRSLIPDTNKGHLITSTIEHAAVYQTMKFLESTGIDITYIKPNEEGRIDPLDVQKAIKPSTRGIVLSAANSETGVKNDLVAFSSLSMQAEIPFIVDGVALIGKEDFVIPPGVTGMAFSGHKFHGPKGVGFAFVRSSFKLLPQNFGGGQESGKRSGTENLLGIVGMAKAIEILAKQNAALHMEAMRDRLEKGLQSQIDGVIINGKGPRIANTSNISFADVDGESLLIHLDMAGIAVSHGSACSSGALEPSRVLLEMGLSPKIAKTAIRFSLSRFTTEQEIDLAIEKTCAIVHKIQFISK